LIFNSPSPYQNLRKKIVDLRTHKKLNKMTNFVKTIMLSVLIGVSTQSYSQSIGSTPINELDANYIRIVGQQKLLKLFEINIYIDFGQVGSLKESKEAKVLDKNGKKMTFNGMMGAVNYLSEYGYELLFTYPLTTSSGNIYHYIMKKKEE